MPKKLSVEEREKIDRLRERWRKADAKARAANMEIGADKKASFDVIRASAVKMGIPKSAWNDFMTELDHVDSAVSHREKVVAADDQDRLTAYDRLLLAQDDVLPLFPAEMISEMETSAALEPAEDEVADLDARREAKAAERAAARAAERESSKEAAG